MSISRISSRYAKSLMDLAIERNELDTVKTDLESFAKLLDNRDLYNMLKSPIINGSKKLQVFKSLFENNTNKTLFAFFEIIIKKGREAFLPEISAEFLNQYKVYNRISTVYITTATTLSESALYDIKSKLLSSDITMDKLDIVTRVNPNILGGFIIEIGDKLYDASVQHKLDKLRKEIISSNIA